MSGRRAERGKRAVRGNLKEHMQARSTEGERGKEPPQKKKKRGVFSLMQTEMRLNFREIPAPILRVHVAMQCAKGGGREER